MSGMQRSVVLQAVVETYTDSRSHVFVHRAKALAWMTSLIDRDEWVQWRDSLVAHDPSAVAPEPGVDPDEQVLESWFGDHVTETHKSHPDLVGEAWSAAADCFASLHQIRLDDPTTSWEDQ